MMNAIQYMFADVATKLEDLHAIAVEGQSADNAPDMQDALNAHLRSGLVAVNGATLAMAKALEGSRS